MKTHFFLLLMQNEQNNFSSFEKKRYNYLICVINLFETKLRKDLRHESV